MILRDFESDILSVVISVCWRRRKFDYCKVSVVDTLQFSLL